MARSRRARNPLRVETLLDIRLSAILAAAAGLWAGFTEKDEAAQPLIAAVMQLDLPGLDEAIELGRFRAAQSAHATPPATH